MITEQSWLVGLDLGPRSSGALRFTRMLRQRLHARVVGVFVRETWLLGASPGEDAAPSLRDRAENYLAGLDAGAPNAAVDATRIVDEIDAETGLAKLAQGAAGVVVGRCTLGPEPWSRLGRVTRRLLRRLPAPVVVVPPEPTADEFDGPVLLATDLAARSGAAARFAVTFARRLGRPLVCVHVGQPRWEEKYAALEPRWVELRSRYHEATEQATRAWTREHCPEAELMFEYGDPLARLSALAQQLRPNLMVVGSGRPGLVERFFAGSTASGVASVAPCAVAVVPPDLPGA